MAELNPPAWLQNSGATNTAQLTRLSVNSLLTGATAAGAMRTRGGINRALGGALKVQATGTPGMTVDVLSGVGFVPGLLNTMQGTYTVVNDATTNKAIAAAHASLARIDSVYLKVEDSIYAGAVNSWSITVATGTPASSPVAPTLTGNYMLLANITVGASVTSITNGNISDQRQYIAGVGGVINCTSTTRPATATIVEGQIIYEEDTDLWYGYNGTSFIALATSTNLANPTPIIARMRRAANQAVGAAAFVALAFDTEDYDIGGGHSTSVNVSRYTCTKDGKYLVNPWASFSSDNSGIRIVCAQKNGGPLQVALVEIPTVFTGGSATAINGTDIIPLVVGDYIETVVYHTAATNPLNVNGGLNVMYVST